MSATLDSPLKLTSLNEMIYTSKWQELFKKFSEEGVTEKFKAVCLKVEEEEERKFNEEFKKLCEVWEEKLQIEMIQMEGLEGVTGMNSSTLQNLAMGIPFEPEGKLKRKREEELDGTHRDKRPATAYPTPSHPPIRGFMAEAHQSAAALTAQRSLFSSDEGTQIKMTQAAHDKEASTSSWEPPQVEPKTFTFDELGQVSIEGPSLYSVLQDAVPDMDIWNILLDLPSDLETCTGNLAGYCEGELQSSTMPLMAGAMNSTGTGESYHDPLGMQGETTAAAGSFGGPSTQSSQHNEKF
ncbi:hypothetical protein SLE2022_397490 [Rubroshorea leprosula]